MRESWIYGILDDAVDKGSSNISLNKIQDEIGEYPVFGAKGFMKNVSFFQQEKEYLGIIKDGAGIGRVSKHPSKSSVLATMQYIIPKAEFNIDFVRYFLESLNFEEFRTGSTIPHIYYKDYKNAKFPLVEENEQKQIVNILNKAFTSIFQAKVNIEKNIQNAKELFQSKLNDIFSQKGDGWEEKTLAEVSFEFARGKSKHRPRGDSSLLNGKYPLIQTGDIANSNHWINVYTRSYNEKGLNQSKLWPKSTVCIAIVGANVAETAILNFDSCFPDSVIGIIVNPQKANNEYVDYLLQFFKLYLKEKGKGTARDNINLGTFKNQKFPFPKVKRQNDIVEKLNLLSTELQELESNYIKKLSNIDELKKSILKKAFAGELTNNTVEV